MSFFTDNYSRNSHLRNYDFDLSRFMLLRDEVIRAVRVQALDTILVPAGPLYHYYVSTVFETYIKGMDWQAG